jgi:hypothetical protein
MAYLRKATQKDPPNKLALCFERHHILEHHLEAFKTHRSADLDWQFRRIAHGLFEGKNHHCVLGAKGAQQDFRW